MAQEDAQKSPSAAAALAAAASMRSEKAAKPKICCFGCYALLFILLEIWL